MNMIKCDAPRTANSDTWTKTANYVTLENWVTFPRC